jgi:hypothetical protein
MAKLVARTVTKTIGCPQLSLYQGNGYWYFIFDDVARNIHESHSVYTMRLNDMPLDRWVDIGRTFAERVGLNGGK